MATLAEPLDRGFSAGRVFERAIAAFLRNPVVAIAIALLLAGLPAAAFELLLSTVRPEFLVLTIAGYALPGSIAILAIGWFASHIFGSFTQGAMATVLVADEQSRKARLGEAIASALRSFLPLLTVGVLTGLAVEIGATLLIVPAVYVFMLWSVAPSAVTQEGEGMFMAFNRSQELGEGARWKMFGIIFLLFVVASLLSISATFLGRLDGVSLRSATLSVGYLLTATTIVPWRT